VQPKIASRLMCIAVVTVAVEILLSAQAGTGTRPSFEVASIKLSNTKNSAVSLGFKPGSGRLAARNISAKVLIAFAYQLQDFQISGGQGWVSSDHFDVDARADDDVAAPDQVFLMVQSLLADRFRLTVHRETKESSVYALVVGRGGLKIKLSSDQTLGAGLGPHGDMKIGPGSLIATAVPLSLFASLLSRQLGGRSVINRTGLTGRYDIELRWSPDVGQTQFGAGASGDTPSPTNIAGPSIFTAVQEELGLKLESTKGPAEILVIDYIEKPSAN
jgi:uncharacterized protein (TIGR03435 family)